MDSRRMYGLSRYLRVIRIALFFVHISRKLGDDIYSPSVFQSLVVLFFRFLSTHGALWPGCAVASQNG